MSDGNGHDRSELPAPLTPSDCDLRGYNWMPLFGGKLFTSKFAAHAADAVFRAALRLWWEAWLQVPAASLPDDDMELCLLAGCERRTWAKLKASDVLHGFVKCADGRLYHPLLAPHAKVAWDRRLKERHRKREQRDTASYPDGDEMDVPRDNHRDGAWDGRRTGQGTGGGCPAPRGTESEIESKKGRSTPLPPTAAEAGTPASPGTPPGHRPDGNSRSLATNPRKTGGNPRFLGTNARQGGTNPRSSRDDDIDRMREAVNQARMARLGASAKRKTPV